MGQQHEASRLKQQIARLKHDVRGRRTTSEYELGLDNIRIPSVYEVGTDGQGRRRRRDKAARHNAVTNANTIYITVNGRQDYQQLGKVLEKHVKGAGKATARAAQMR
jgi:hypothetical protein